MSSRSSIDSHTSMAKGRFGFPAAIIAASAAPLATPLPAPSVSIQTCFYLPLASLSFLLYHFVYRRYIKTIKMRVGRRTAVLPARRRASGASHRPLRPLDPNPRTPALQSLTPAQVLMPVFSPPPPFFSVFFILCPSLPLTLKPPTSFFFILALGRVLFSPRRL